MAEAPDGHHSTGELDQTSHPIPDREVVSQASTLVEVQPPLAQLSQKSSNQWSTPELISPPITKTPPTEERHRNDQDTAQSNTSVGQIDADELTKRLQGAEASGSRHSGHSPGASPRRKRPRVYGDRFIPNRQGQDFHAGFSLLHDDDSPSTPSRSKKRTPHHELHFQRTEEANRTHSALLRSELFDDSVPSAIPSNLSNLSDSSRRSGSARANTPPNTTSFLPASTLTPSTPHKNLFTYSSPRHHSLASGQLSPSRTPSSRRSVNLDTRAEIYSLSPVKLSSQQMLLSPRKAPRTVSKVPYKVLDAPELADDFYLNLVDWGSSNILGVGLSHCVYMWSANTGQVVKLCELPDDTITSVNWIQRGSHLAIGTHKGHVQIWDAEQKRKLRTMTGHTSRVGALAWNEHILTSGSRDRSILHRDVRQRDQYLRKLVGHKQEVCGLKWNPDDGQLASGGNDNKLMVWDNLSEDPLYKFTEHNAAVKAIAWSPHQRGLLASGGGTADRKIRFWNTMSGTLMNEVDTGSQVCNLAWSKNSNEIVSTHGYSQNQIVVWKYPSMTQVVSLTGHTYRVLYLAMSPDGQVIVTGAGDETLRFWNCFKRKEVSSSGIGKIDDWGAIR